MAAGEAAQAAGIPIYTGNEDANQLWVRDNEILDQIAADRTATRSLARGGTGATDAAAARANLGFPTLGAGNQMPPNAIAVSNAQQQLTTADPTLPGHAASKGYVDAVAGGGGWNGGVVTGQIYLTNAFPANSGYSVCYINSDGRISRNASALRFKKYVSKIDPLGLGNLFPDLVRYKLRAQDLGNGERSPSDEAWHYGHIADWLAEDPDLQKFAVYEVEPDAFGRPVPLSIDFIALLLAQTAQLNARVLTLEARLADLEGKLA